VKMKLSSSILLLPLALAMPMHPYSYPHPSSYISHADAYVAVQQTLSKYPLALDTKNFSALAEVFTADVVANYSAVGPPVFHGLAAIEAGLQAA